LELRQSLSQLAVFELLVERLSNATVITTSAINEVNALATKNLIVAGTSGDLVIAVSAINDIVSR
jgi:hypothetical protein